MTGYPFIQEFFTGVLQKSQAIAGRFFICPQMGREMNSDELGQVIQDTVNAASLTKKYPLALMMPPISMGDYTASSREWDDYRIMIFFLNSTYYNGANQVKSANTSTKTSTHTIVQDWHDMKRVAVNFIRVVDQVSREKRMIQSLFRLDQSIARVVTPVSMVGVDKASGVRLEFGVSLFTGCALEDYDSGVLANIDIPSEDSHPGHTL